MPVSPDTGSRSAAPVADLMTRLELEMLEQAALALRGDQTKPEWAAQTLARIRRLRAQQQAGVGRATQELGQAVRAALLQAQVDGAAEALVDLPDLGTVPPIDTRGVMLNARRLTKLLAETLQQAPALLEQVLREAVRAGVDEVRETDSKTTRRMASQRVLNKLVQQGITGFRDKAGRNWSLSSYCEMAVRTESQAAALEAGEQRIRALGLDSVLVSDSPRECPLCRPFEGKRLKLDGTGAGTLAGARARGFQHPNCTHSISGFIPGHTKTGATANPDGYDEKQKQRHLERKVREAKRAQALALSPEAKRVATTRVRERTAALREYVGAHGLKRQPGRESIKNAV